MTFCCPVDRCGHGRCSRLIHPCRLVLRLLGLVLLLPVIGCPPPVPPAPIPPAISRAQALQRYNRNVASVPAFSAHLSQWKTAGTDPATDKEFSHSDSGGRLFYHPALLPADRPSFYLRANSSFASEALVIGCNADEFWIYSEPGNFGGWGDFDAETEIATPGMFIDPEILLECVGLRPLPASLLTESHFYKIRPERNIMEYATDVRGGSYLREIILDRRTDLPVEINHYDQHGQWVVHTELGNYQPLADAMLPGEVIITFPVDGSLLQLKLDRFRPDQKDRSRLFTRPQEKLGPDHYGHISPLSQDE